ncbi:CHAT domain-containing protein [Stieleria varia]|uniref:CHAT domain protein n=1 Tax=Stieleria varia TaxID=2528005 RepID=A0A5C6A1W6_9BACT|nr:CHAT domain-containing protein [Stieleria varia]TWT93842.1 CHAT domain protein [Stieleria varia]
MSASILGLAPSAIRLLLAVFLVTSSSMALFGQEKDQVEGKASQEDLATKVITIAQGRALLASDASLEHGRAAVFKKDWPEAKRFLDNALAEERKAFGDSYPGNSELLFLLNIANRNLGDGNDELTNQLTASLDFADSADWSVLPPEDRKRLTNQTREYKEKLLKETLRLVSAVGDLGSLADQQGTPEFAAVAKALYMQYRALEAMFKESFDEQRKTLIQIAELGGIDAEQDKDTQQMISDTQSQFETLRDEQLGLLAPMAIAAYAESLPPDQTDLAAELLSEAFDRLQRANPDWAKDENIFYGGRAIANQLVGVLDQQLSEARLAADWQTAQQLLEQILPIVEALGSSIDEWRVLDDEAKRLVSKSHQQRKEYSETIRIEKEDFHRLRNTPQAAQAIPIGVAIVDIRTQILGRDCVQAAWTNRILGYLLWTQQRYVEAMQRLEWSSLSYSKFVSPGNNRMQSAIQDLFINATATTESGLMTTERSQSLHATARTLASRLGKDNATIASAELTLHRLDSLSQFTEQQREAYQTLQKKMTVRDNHFQNGNYATALSVANDVVNETAALFGLDSMESLMAKQAHANCVRMTGDSDAAIESYRSMMKDFDHAPFNKVQGFANVCSEFASLLSYIGGIENQDEALQWIGRAKELTEKTVGKSSYSYVWLLMSEGEILRDGKGKAQTSLTIFQEAGMLINDLGGAESFANAQSLVNVALSQKMLGLYEASDQHLRDALEIRKTQGLNSPHYLAWNLWALGETNFQWGKFQDAAKYYAECLDVKEEFTPGATDIGEVYGNYLASASWMPDPEPAIERVVQRLTKNRSSHYGQDKSAFAAECVRAAGKVMIEPGGSFYGRVSDLRAHTVMRLAAMAVSVLEKTNSDPIALGNALQLLGDAERYLGNHQESVRHYERLLTLLDQVNDAPAWLRGNAHVGLSIAYENLSAFDQCLLQRRKGIDVFSRGYGPQSPQVVNATLGLGCVLMILGDLDDAERLTQEVCDYCGQRQLAEAMRQLAIISRLRGNLGRSEQWLHSARRVTDELKGNQQLLALIDLSLSELYLMRGEFELAKTLAQKTIDSDHLQEQSTAEEILAVATLQTGDLKEAELLLEKRLSVPNPSSRARFAMAALKQSSNDHAAAKQQLLEELQFAVEFQQAYGHVLSQRQKLKVRQRVDGAIDQFVSFALQSDTSQDELYRWLMPMKGLVFEEEFNRREKLRSNTDADSRNLIAKLDAVNQQLSRELFKESAGAARVDTVDRIQNLTLQRENLERSLGLESQSNVPGSQAVFQQGLDQLQQRLGTDDAMIDYIFYYHHDRIGVPNSVPTLKALAFVVRSDSVSMVELGGAEPIRQAIMQWREHLIERNSELFTEANQDLRKLIWSAIEPHVSDRTNLILSVDGSLAQVSFAALPDARNGYLLDHHRITLVSAPRVLLHADEDSEPVPPSSERPRSETDLLLVGGLDYSRPADGKIEVTPARDSHDELIEAIEPALQTTSMIALRSVNPVTAWQPLPGTEAEIRNLKTMAESAEQPMNVTQLTGRAASEAVLKEKMPLARWAHIATHGFFAKQPGEDQNGESSPWAFQSLSQESVVGFDPKLLSGIVVSGGNVRDDDLQDGILTAAEIEVLDLSQTELVVLSACETGLGDGQSGEGVMGLQRSLHLAGCSDVVASLWKVDDAATKILMTSFYQQLWSGKNPAEALRQAQLALRNGELEGSDRLRGVTRVTETNAAPESTRVVAPIYWAAFTISSTNAN